MDGAHGYGSGKAPSHGAGVVANVWSEAFQAEHAPEMAICKEKGTQEETNTSWGPREVFPLPTGEGGVHTELHSLSMGVSKSQICDSKGDC